MSDYAERVKAANTDATLRNLDEWANRQHDPVQQAVDNYILMERKARAWDDLKRWLETDRAVVPWVLAKMDELMQSL